SLICGTLRSLQIRLFAFFFLLRLVVRFPLERVPQTELHYSQRVRIDGCPVSEIRRRCRRTWRESEAAPAEVQTEELLAIGYVEDLPAKLQGVLFVVGHLPGLSQPGIEIDVMRIAKIISQSGFSRIGVTEAQES